MERRSWYDQATSKWQTTPLPKWAAGDTLFLVLHGTGIRHRSSLNAVRVKVGGVAVTPQFAGKEEGFLGLDQINVEVPRELAGKGEVDVVLESIEPNATPRASNAIRVRFQ
jgi:uncharacterized protein (TIGR03437 family)